MAIWQRQWLDGRPLVDSSGRALRVVYPGRRWGGPGPDFQGAVLALEDGALLRGDVEVHLRASDWGAHGHGRDPGYNRTILHVVLHAGAATARQDGVSVPVLELSGRLTAPLSQLAARLSCESGPHHGVACLDSLDDLVTLVDRAGLERFFEKAAGFEAELEVFDPAEALYRGTLVALGYTANKQVCGRLAELLPWGLVRGVAREPDGEALARALLLGAAGLLPGPRGIPVRGPEPRALEQRWRGLAPELGLPPLKAHEWSVASVRPENMPTRRLVGGAALFGRWSRAAQPEELFREIIELGSAGELLNELRARSESGFWAWHYDFDVPTKGPRPWQIGRLRASEILVNVVLPLGYAVGRRRDWPDLSAAALLAYRRLPAAPWNRVTRAMAGLLRLFKRWCWERRCETCPAGAGRERRR